MYEYALLVLLLYRLPMVDSVFPTVLFLSLLPPWKFPSTSSMEISTYFHGSKSNSWKLPPTSMETNLLSWKFPWKLIPPSFTEVNQLPWKLPPTSMEVNLLPLTSIEVAMEVQ